jgi:hypothetical protein
MERAFELGIQVPTRLEDWADFFPRYTVLPWLNGAEHRRLQVMRDYMRLAFNRIPIRRETKHGLSRRVHEWIAGPARWRLDHDYYAFPVELWLKDTVNRWMPPVKSKVDAKQLSAEVAAC